MKWFIIILTSSIAFSATYFVPEDYHTIQEAIDVTSDGDTVLVLPGTYVENISFLGKDITVISKSGPFETTIDGGNSGSVVCFQNNESSAAVLMGFTITNGFANEGGGIRCESASPTIIDNRIIGNETDCIGGGIACFGGSSLIGGNVIFNNRASEYTGEGGKGGGIFADGCSLNIICNLFESNEAIRYWDYSKGGGIYANDCSGVIACNVFLYNEVFTGSGGAISLYGCNGVSIINSVIAENQARVGGGIQCAGGEAICIHNCTITENLAPYGSALEVFACSVSVLNSIIWSNELNEDIYLEQGIMDIAYTDLEDGQEAIAMVSGSILYWGPGMIDADPLFVFGPLSHYHLSDGISPCIDAGHPGTMYFDPEDPENPGYALWPSLGFLRNDMGAYGGGGVGYWLAVEEGENLILEPSATMYCYPNPFMGSATIVLELSEPGYASVQVYDLSGRRIKTLLEEDMINGPISFVFDGSSLPSGVYIVMLQAEEYSISHRLVLFR
ncbi:MAG: T9SS type A sorting domain-containing protein [Candidatus Aegiribacteria sp.]|nr:T9SS type A sorting domain-containing protein [Candidatus Aegiribacteria sp.]